MRPRGRPPPATAARRGRRPCVARRPRQAPRPAATQVPRWRAGCGRRPFASRAPPRRWRHPPLRRPP
eukprot:2325530-Lingulodinium_polyedra.AAC.1